MGDSFAPLEFRSSFEDIADQLNLVHERFILVHVQDHRRTSPVLGEHERVAGMKARQIHIVPRDRYRYGQRLWVAETSHLPLRSEVVDEQGNIIEMLIFTSLEVRDSIPADMLQPTVGEHDQIFELAHQEPSRRAARRSPPGWESIDLPPGFRQKVQRRHFLPNKFSQVEHHVYSDGLASVSVFIEQQDQEEQPLVGASRIGGVNIYGHLHNGHAITVLGEVPGVTVRQIAESMVQVSPP